MPDLHKHSFLSAAPKEAVQCRYCEARRKSVDGVTELKKWAEHITDIAHERGLRPHAHPSHHKIIFRMAKRVLRGEIRDTVERRYNGPETLTDLREFLFEDLRKIQFTTTQAALSQHNASQAKA